MARCKTCGTEIVWCKTKKGKSMPVDVNKREDGNLILDDIDGDTIAIYVGAGEGDHVSHFVTCKQADQHRRK